MYMFLVDARKGATRLFGQGLMVEARTPKGARRKTRKAARLIGLGLPDALYVYLRQDGYWRMVSQIPGPIPVERPCACLTLAGVPAPSPVGVR